MHKAPARDPVEKVGVDTIRVYGEALENIKISKSKRVPFPDLLSLMGKISVTEDRTTLVPARVGGRIESVLVNSGERVERGQLLAKMFAPDFLAAREEYLLSVKGEKGDETDFGNLAQMARKKLLTMGLLESDIKSIRASDDDGKRLLSIRAPRDGVLIQKGAVLGTLNNVGDTLFVIGDLSKVWFSGDLYPEDLPKVREGQQVFINAVGVAKPLFGKVSFISPLVDPATRSIKIRAAMDNPEKALKMDEYVQGNVVLEDKEALVVPALAIVRTPEGPVVFKQVTPLAAESEKDALETKKLVNFFDRLDFKKVAVKTGNVQGDSIAVIEGLNAGDIVVSDGGWLLDAALNSEAK